MLMFSFSIFIFSEANRRVGRSSLRNPRAGRKRAHELFPFFPGIFFLSFLFSFLLNKISWANIEFPGIQDNFPSNSTGLTLKKYEGITMPKKKGTCMRSSNCIDNPGDNILATSGKSDVIHWQLHIKRKKLSRIQCLLGVNMELLFCFGNKQILIFLLLRNWDCRVVEICWSSSNVELFSWNLVVCAELHFPLKKRVYSLCFDG